MLLFLQSVRRLSGPATCSLRLARQPEARVFPRAVRHSAYSRAIQVLIAGCAAEGATSFEFETATIYNCNKRSAVVEATARSSAVHLYLQQEFRDRTWWKKCCLQRPAFVSNCMLLSVSLS